MGASFCVRPLYNSFMNSDPMKDRSIPIILFIITTITYGLLLTQTGFYWDDWPFAWTAEFLGPWEFVPAFQGVRPFLGPIFLATTSVIPPIPIYWQIFAILIRFLSGLSAWFAFNQIWPRHKRHVFVAALLFLVYPGYSQHWVAFTHINQEWISLICLLLSFGFAGRSLREPERFRSSTALALVFLALGIFPTEYFLGLGLLHLPLIWSVIRQRTDQPVQRLTTSLKLWLPYFFVWLANVLWLIYFYTVGSYDSYGVEAAKQPISLLQVFVATGEAIWKAGIYSWGQIIPLIGRTIRTTSSLFTIAIMAAMFVFVFFLLSKKEDGDVEPYGFSKLAISIGILGIVLGRIPSFAAWLPLTLQSSYDRFTISMMIGASLFVTGIVDWLIQNRRIKQLAFALLIAVSIGQQFYNANSFRRDWAMQQQLFWQLAWRIPAMQPGTALLTHELPLDSETDLSVSAAINWMYAPEYTRSDLPYALFYTEKRLGGPSLPSLLPNTDITMGLRRVSFHGTTSQVIVIYMPRDGCLRVLDPRLGDESTYDRQSHHLVDAIQLSNPDLILTNSNYTAQLPFLREPEHTWCYYYAKSELARQSGDWQRVIHLYQEATSLGYESNDPIESLVFIEAYAMTNELNIAQRMSEDALISDKRVRRGLCEVWKRVQASGDGGDELEMGVNQMLSRFQCAR